MQTITVDQLMEKMDSGEELHLIDVRELSEHKEFNIGGILLPLGKIQRMQVDEIEGLKETEVICYCRSGNRSAQACMYLHTMGFRNAFNLSGGMIAWKQKFGTKKSS